MNKSYLFLHYENMDKSSSDILLKQLSIAKQKTTILPQNTNKLKNIRPKHNIANPDELYDIHMCRPYEITKINNMREKRCFDDIMVLRNKTNQIACPRTKIMPTSKVSFELPYEVRWLYNYNVKQSNIGSLIEYTIDISTIPDEHIIVNEKTVLLHIYAFYKTNRTYSILFSPVNDVEIGHIIRTHTIV